MLVNQASSLTSVIDAASIVFAHSFFEAAVMDLCQAVALAKPEDWEFVVGERKLSLNDLKGRNYQEILGLCLSSYFQQLEREALPVKVDRLIKVSKPSPKMLASEGYEYSRERLVEIDELRHSLVHGDNPKRLNSIDSDLKFLETTIFRLAGGVIEQYELVLDPETLIKEASAKGWGTDGDT